MAYDWPGNVRELENCLIRAGDMTSGPVIHVADLPSQMKNGNPSHPNLVMMSASSNGVVSMAAMEKRAILSALEHVKGDTLLAARLLGIGKTTLYRKLKEYGAE